MAEIITGNWKIEIEAANNPAFSSDRLVGILKLLNDLQISANMEKFDFIKRPDGRFDYEFKAFDGRKWAQIIDVTNQADYSMTFNTDDAWRLSEFLPHRPLRDHVVKMSHEFQLEWIKVRLV